MSSPIILTHYGACDYLKASLDAIGISNPETARILIGDNANKDIVVDSGWEHIDRWTLKSALKARFSEDFRWIQGRKHVCIKNGEDWLRWQWERWFHIEVLTRERGIERFWHFDSDVLVVESLEKIESWLGTRDNIFYGSPNLNGYCTRKVISQLCTYAASLYADNAFLDEKKREINQANPDYAFTEMNALRMFFERSSAYEWQDINASLACRGYFMDSALMIEEGMCMTTTFGFTKGFLKDVYWDKSGGFWCKSRDGRRLRLISLNCSWLPLAVNQWCVNMLSKYAIANGCELPDRQRSIRFALRIRDMSSFTYFLRYIYVPLKSFTFAIRLKVLTRQLAAHCISLIDSRRSGQAKGAEYK